MNWETELSQFDEGFAVEARIGQGGERQALASKVYNGVYTLKMQEDKHRTFRIHTRGGSGMMAGMRLISQLVGPDNQADYVPFGFVDEKGIRIWKKYREKWTLVAYAETLWKLLDGEEVPGCSLLVQRHCLVCNRTLTDPESIERGIGPYCWDRVREQKQ